MRLQHTELLVSGLSTDGLAGFEVRTAGSTGKFETTSRETLNSNSTRSARSWASSGGDSDHRTRGGDSRTLVIGSARHRRKPKRSFYSIAGYPERCRASLCAAISVTGATPQFLVNPRMKNPKQVGWSRLDGDLTIQLRCGIDGGAAAREFGQESRPQVISLRRWRHSPTSTTFWTLHPLIDTFVRLLAIEAAANAVTRASVALFDCSDERHPDRSAILIGSERRSACRTHLLRNHKIGDYEGSRFRPVAVP
jgi:hypothetical protein